MSNPGATRDVRPEALRAFDAIIDVRSPGEFAEDHIPGAVNLPVLDDEERARVGTTYVQVSRFLARRMGASLVAANIARHLETALAHEGPGFRPLVYCWRGGQRSGAMALVLAQVGWRVMVLEGGYKTYRRAVQTRLYDQACDVRFVLLEGGTGCAKTELLGRLAARGVQVLDLEKLARHRGSLFGALADAPQPSQKGFESALLHQLDGMDVSRPVLVEAESSKIGARTLPPAVWRAMEAAPAILVSAPIGARAAYLAACYPDIIADAGRLERVLSRLEVYPGRRLLENWRVLAAEGAYVELIRQVVERHYDPSYERQAGRCERQRLARLELTDLSDQSQSQAADRIAEILEGWRP
jgi:tRNA 2-selenouridine synthase